MELEDRLKKTRNQCKEEVTSFLDRNISDRLDKISRGVKRVDARLYSHHQVSATPYGSSTHYIHQSPNPGMINFYFTCSQSIAISRS